MAICIRCNQNKWNMICKDCADADVDKGLLFAEKAGKADAQIADLKDKLSRRNAQITDLRGQMKKAIYPKRDESLPIIESDNQGKFLLNLVPKFEQRYSPFALKQLVEDLELIVRAYRSNEQYLK